MLMYLEISKKSDKSRGDYEPDEEYKATSFRCSLQSAKNGVRKFATRYTAFATSFHRIATLVWRDSSK